MKKLHISFMTDLFNIDFAEAYGFVINYIEQEKVGNGDLKIVSERVKSHKTKLHELRNRGRNTLSILNGELTRTRTDYLISLRLRVKSFMRSHLPNERTAAKRIYLILRSYDNSYYVPTIIQQTSFVKSIVNYGKEHKDFKEALTLLELDGLMEATVEITKEIMANYLQCVNDSGKSKSKSKDARSAAYRDLRTLADTLNVMLDLHRENEEKRAIAQEMILNINYRLEDFHTALKIRNTKRKNRKYRDTAVTNLINNHLTSIQIEQTKKDLPSVIYSDLKIDQSALQRINKTKGAENNKSNDVTNSKRKPKTDPKNNSINPSPHNKDKGKEAKGEDDKLPQ